jgi:hypothetical protein
MSDEPARTRIHIGTFGEGLPRVLYFPPGSLKPAEQILDREREKREALVVKAKMQVLQQARAQGRQRKALKLVIRGRGR